MLNLTRPSALLLGNCSNTVQSSVRHVVLLLPYRHLFGNCQSILTHTQRSNELDMVCRRIPPFGSITCSQVRPIAFGWPLPPAGGLGQSSLSLSREEANGERPEKRSICSSTFALATRCSSTTRSTARPIEQEHVCTYSRWRSPVHDLEYERAYWDLQVLRNFPGRGSMYILHDLPRTTTSSVFKKFMGRMIFYQAIQVLAPQFRLFGTFVPNSLNAGGSAVCIIHKNLLLDGAIVTHVVTCQGRDHIVTIQSGDRNLVVVNVQCSL